MSSGLVVPSWGENSLCESVGVCDEEDEVIVLEAEEGEELEDEGGEALEEEGREGEGERERGRRGGRVGGRSSGVGEGLARRERKGGTGSTHGIVLHARRANDACGDPEGGAAFAAEVDEDLLAGLQTQHKNHRQQRALEKEHAIRDGWKRGMDEECTYSKLIRPWLVAVLGRVEAGGRDGVRDG